MPVGWRGVTGPTNDGDILSPVRCTQARIPHGPSAPGRIWVGRPSQLAAGLNRARDADYVLQRPDARAHGRLANPEDLRRAAETQILSDQGTILPLFLNTFREHDTSRSLKEAGQIIRHRWHQETAVEEEVSHLAARFGDQQTAMARGAVCCSIAAPIVWFMIGTNWVI